MLLPNPADTIVALASAAAGAPLALLRISGGQAWELAGRLGATPPVDGAGRFSSGRTFLPETGAFPHLAFWYRAPMSFTGDDLVELQVPGSPPLVAALLAALRASGARAALPGEFTARRFLRGKIEAGGVDALLDLLAAADADQARAAVRGAAGRSGQRIAAARERLIDVLARVEAGIDFTDEEDVRFVTTEECLSAFDGVARELGEMRSAAAAQRRSALPHVVLAGRPNAGKSTLFNALVGAGRAIVAPVAGTTRDLLVAEIDLGGVGAVLVDTAGLFEGEGGEAELRSTNANVDVLAQAVARRAWSSADVLVWVQPADEPWDAPLREVATGAARRVWVWSKCDLADPAVAPPAEFSAPIQTAAKAGRGIAVLRDRLRGELARRPAAQPGAAWLADALADAVSPVARARGLAAEGAPPELLAVELRAACAALERIGAGPDSEQVLSRIFAQFCIGK